MSLWTYNRLNEGSSTPKSVGFFSATVKQNGPSSHVCPSSTYTDPVVEKLVDAESVKGELYQTITNTGRWLFFFCVYCNIQSSVIVQ